jgi:hypothetical protein
VEQPASIRKAFRLVENFDYRADLAKREGLAAAVTCLGLLVALVGVAKIVKARQKPKPRAKLRVVA